MSNVRKIQINIVITQKDYFENRQSTFKDRPLILKSCIRYLALDDVLEILEYDYVRKNNANLIITDGSELITIPRKGGIARRERVAFRIDPLLLNQGKLYLSLRSINRLFNVDLAANLTKKHLFIRQPGRFFIAFRGDTLRSISRLLNTSVNQLLSRNKNLKEPIQTGTSIRIPAITASVQRKNTASPIPRTVQIKQIEKAPAIIALGKKLRGTPYRFGAGPFPITRRFDCSSFTQYIFGRNGVQLPRTSRAQTRVGKAIRQRDIEPGDLIFFRRPRYSDNRIGHVGVDIGNGRMINTYRSPPGVTITNWKSNYWRKYYVTAREVL